MHPFLMLHCYVNVMVISSIICPRNRKDVKRKDHLWITLKVPLQYFPCGMWSNINCTLSVFTTVEFGLSVLFNFLSYFC